MGTLFALLVGIDDYRGRLKTLHGAAGDVRDVAEVLRGWSNCKVLLNEQASKGAIVAAFEEHLGQAREDDSVLFYFAGHGSQVPVPERLAHTEPSGMLQTIVCADSRTPGVTDLLDKELAVLLADVVRSGPHVAVVLDCCHSESGTRSDNASSVRGADPLLVPPADDELLPRLLAPLRATDVPSGAPTHVLLSACDTHEKAEERPTPRGVRGVFSYALLNQLSRLPVGTTYRSLAGAVACEVENMSRTQRPVLWPAGHSVVDQPFLGGARLAPVSGTTARHVRGQWRVNAGACHGLSVGTGASLVEFGVADGHESGRFRVLATTAVDSTLAPIGWIPDPAAQYPLVLTSVPLPTTTVGCGHSSLPGPNWLTGAIAVAASGGTPSAHVRVVDAEHPSADLRVVVPRPHEVDVLDGGGVPLATGLPADNPAGVVRVLEHIARWQRVKELRNPVSALTGAVRMQIVAETGDRVPTDASGRFQLAYEGDRAPRILLRLNNTRDRDLYCAVLNLSEGFSLHPELMPGSWVRSRYTATAADGFPVELGLPPEEPLVPGARTRDWFLLLVSEQPFSTDPFVLPPLGEPERGHARSAAVTGVIDRLGLTALHRQARVVVPAVDWTTSIVSLVTSVPQ